MRLIHVVNLYGLTNGYDNMAHETQKSDVTRVAYGETCTDGGKTWSMYYGVLGGTIPHHSDAALAMLQSCTLVLDLVRRFTA